MKREVLETAQRVLECCRIENPIRETGLLLRLAQRKCGSKEGKKVAECFFSLIERRSNHEPYAYIAEEKEFYNLNFKVTRDTLIPRPDTELLVDCTLDIINSRKGEGLNIIELGVGSGAIILSIMDEIRKQDSEYFSTLKWNATDISSKALEIAKTNAKRFNLLNDIVFEERDWVKGLDLSLYDIIISNPPYIPSIEIQKLHPTVSTWEPALALDGGIDGLYFYQSLAVALSNHKQRKNQNILLEIGYDQGAQVSSLFSNILHVNTEIKQDLGNRDRVCFFTNTVRQIECINKE